MYKNELKSTILVLWNPIIFRMVYRKYQKLIRVHSDPGKLTHEALKLIQGSYKIFFVSKFFLKTAVSFLKSLHHSINTYLWQIFIIQLLDNKKAKKSKKSERNNEI